jgi:hypothetical protein
MYLRQLMGFFIRASQDHRIGASHVAVYMALFQQWCINECRNPVSITRAIIMQAAKIRRTAYHKVMKDLNEYGYIKYLPSYHPVLGSLVYLTECYP